MSEEFEQQAVIQKEWIPRTRLGKLVVEGKIRTIDEILRRGIPIKEPEIVDILLPNLQKEIIEVRKVQRQTDAGELSQIRVIVAVGDGENFVGIGKGKGKEFRMAFDDAVRNAKLNLIKVRKGCGSWECGCGRPHSVPVLARGKSGSVRVEIMPAPRGLGLVCSETARIILKLAGVKDARVFSRGMSRNRMNYALAIYNALLNMSRMNLPNDWKR